MKFPISSSLLRSLALALMALALVASGACQLFPDGVEQSGSPTPATPTRPPETPTPTIPADALRLAVPRDLVAELAEPLAQLRAEFPRLYLRETGNSTEARDLVTAGGAEWALVVADTAPAEARSLRTEPYVLVAHPTWIEGNVTLADLRAAYAGRGSLHATLVVVGDGTAEHDWLGVNSIGGNIVRAASPAEAVATVRTHRRTLALVPWSVVDFHVRMVAIGGQSVRPNNLDAYPYTRRIWLTGSRDALPALYDALQARLGYEPSPLVSVVCVGDLMLTRNVAAPIRDNGPLYPFQQALSLTLEADIACGNLELPVTTRSGPVATGGGYGFRGDPVIVQGLVGAGFDVVTLANNHTTDMGEGGLLDTMRYLEEVSIGWVGAGRNREGAHAAWVTEVRGVRVAFLGYNGVGARGNAAGENHAGLAWLDAAAMAADVRRARQQADVVVVNCHWGEEYTYRLDPERRAVVDALVQAGADLVVGHHPHNVQNVAFFDHTFVAYSLGNYVFDQDWSEESSQGLALRCLVDINGLRSVELVPLSIQETQPRVLPRAESRVVLYPAFGQPEATGVAGLTTTVSAPAGVAWAQRLRGPASVATAADLDADGTPEALVGTAGIEVPGYVQAFGGDGALRWATELDTRVHDLRPADLDGDGKAEAVVGTGLLDRAAWIYALDDDGREIWRHQSEAEIEGVYAADLTGDGRPEALGAEWGSFNVTIYIMDGRTGHLLWPYIPSGTTNAFWVADVNGDNKVEVILAADGFYVLAGASGELLWRKNGPYVNDVVAADLDGDGKLEVVGGLRYPAGGVQVRRGADGAPVWRTPLDSSVNRVAVADLDGDRTPEVLAVTVGGGVHCLNADGTVRWTHRVPGSANRVVVADVLGNTAPEIVVAHGDWFTPGGVDVLSGDGKLLARLPDASGVPALAVADFDGDGRNEVVAGDWAGWAYLWRSE
jgi:poly-gamma-glutamate synthesis protein (capsule biosynthesis protein)